MLGRLPLRDRAEAIARINRYATLGRPFLFLVNYAAKRAVVEPLDALAPNALAYDFGGVSNLLLSGKSFTRRKIRLKSSCRISASFVTLLVAKKL